MILYILLIKTKDILHSHPIDDLQIILVRIALVPFTPETGNLQGKRATSRIFIIHPITNRLLHRLHPFRTFRHIMHQILQHFHRIDHLVRLCSQFHHETSGLLRSIQGRMFQTGIYLISERAKLTDLLKHQGWHIPSEISAKQPGNRTIFLSLQRIDIHIGIDYALRDILHVHEKDSRLIIRHKITDIGRVRWNTYLLQG